MKKSSLLFVSALLASPAFAQGGDDCSTATAVAAPGTLAFDTTAATTSGFNGGGTCAVGADTINQDLFWQYTATSAGTLVVDTFGSTYDTKLSVHAGTGCAATCSGYNDDSGSLQSQVSIAGVSAGDTFLIQVGGFGTSFGIGTLNIAEVAPAGPGDDCSSAVAVAATGAIAFDTSGATTTGFTGTGTCGFGADTINQDLFWQFTVPAAGDYQFDTAGSTFDTKISVHTGVGCAAVCTEYNDDANGTLQSEVTVSGLAAGDQLLIQVGGFGASFGAGTLNIGTFVDPCSSLTPDAFEDNDDCATATIIGDGSYPGLNAARSDADFFTFAVADGDTVDVLADHINVDGDIDIYLWDPSVACGTASNGEGNVPGVLALGFTFADAETLSYTNTTGADQIVVLEIDIWDGGTAGDCNPDYTLTITGSTPIGSTGIGTAFCMANNNSTGVPGLISATGSTAVANNDVTLAVDQVPALQFGIFVVSAAAGSMTPVNSGILCLSGQIGRYDQPGFIWQADANGQASRAIDLTAVPTPNAFVSTNPGDTWFFQAWHRDIPSGNSNFTNGVEITFN